MPEYYEQLYKFMELSFKTFQNDLAGEIHDSLYYNQLSDEGRKSIEQYLARDAELHALFLPLAMFKAAPYNYEEWDQIIGGFMYAIDETKANIFDPQILKMVMDFTLAQCEGHPLESKVRDYIELTPSEASSPPFDVKAAFNCLMDEQLYRFLTDYEDVVTALYERKQTVGHQDRLTAYIERNDMINSSLTALVATVFAPDNSHAQGWGVTALMGQIDEIGTNLYPEEPEFACAMLEYISSNLRSNPWAYEINEKIMEWIIQKTYFVDDQSPPDSPAAPAP